jgi:ABC-2 type transport system permease protein
VHDAILIVRREFRERVASRSFLIGTVIFPLIMIGLILLPRLVGSGGTERTIIVINDGPAGVGAAFAAALGATPTSADENTYDVKVVPGPYTAVRESLNSQVERKEIDGYVVLPAEVLTSGTIMFRARNVGSFAVMRDLRSAGTRAVQSERLKTAGISAQAVAALIAPVNVDEAKITSRGEERGGALSTFLAAYVVAFLIYVMTTLYGVAVMRSVLEEKTNRIAEVLMSTIRASHLVFGKIIGVGSAAVTQVIIWAAILTLFVTQSHRLGDRFALPDSIMQALRVEPLTGVLLFLFFLLGFFLYASVFATVGASVTSEQEAQSVQFIALLPLISPLLFLESILNAPLGRTATTLGLIPFTAPIAMPMRMASSPVPPIEIAVSLVLLACAIAVVAWIAGKIYRVGILSTGKRPTLAELGRWVVRSS